MSSYKIEAKLIDLIHAHPSTWNKAYHGFKDPDMKENSWKSIANSLNISVDDCKKTYKYLREKYRREKNLQKQSNNRKPWVLMDHLAFLDDVQKRRRTKNNLFLLEPETSTSSTHDSFSNEKFSFNEMDSDASPEADINFEQSHIKIEYDTEVQQPETSTAIENVLIEEKPDEIEAVASKSLVTSTEKLLEREPCCITTFCNYLKSELERFPAEDADEFIDELNMCLIRKKQQLRTKNKK